MRELIQEFDRDFKGGLFFIERLNKWIIPLTIKDTLVFYRDIEEDRIFFGKFKYDEFIPYDSSNLGYIFDGMNLRYYQRFPVRQYNKSITPSNTSFPNSMKSLLDRRFLEVTEDTVQMLKKGIIREFPLSKHFCLRRDTSNVYFLMYCEKTVALTRFSTERGKFYIDDYLIPDTMVYLMDYLVKKELSNAFEDE